MPSESSVIFQPYRLGPILLRNRMVMPAIGTEYARDGFVTERLIRYYERRAQGGVGLIHVEFCAVDAGGQTNSNQPRLDDDRFIPGLRELVQRLHRLGVPVVLQLAHAGRQMSQKLSGRQPVAPSAIPCPLIRSTPRALETEEVEQLSERFAQAAGRARDAGFDGVQLHGAHGYLLHSFVSPTSNHRSDRFGGSWENRIRFPLQTLEKVRAAVGPDYLVGYKISAREYMEDGLTIEDTTELAKELERHGIDYIEVSSGTYAHMHHIIQPMIFPRGCLVPFAAHMKRHLHIPVVAVGRINDPEVAEDIVRRGDADLVAVGRGLLADPDLPVKASEGRLEDIRRCVACNECMSLLFQLKDVACLINPELGRERELDMRPVAVRKRVLIAGAGPAGLQAAITASEKGHEVILCERENWLGGKLPIVGAPPGKSEYADYRKYLLAQLGKSNVRVLLGTSVTRRLVQELRPTDVIFATGARAVTPDLPGVHARHVFTADDALRQTIPGPRVVVLGASGTGCETAQFLHKAGHEVTVVARSNKAARSIEPITRAVVLEEMRKAGIRMMFGLDCREITPSSVRCARADGQPLEIDCDSVVLARGYVSDDSLARELDGCGCQVHTVGDAVEPRRILEAITEAVLCAIAL